MISVQDIIGRAALLLLDEDRDPAVARWTDAELLQWINDSRMAILTRRPVSCSKDAALALVAGTKQTLPADGVQLFDVIRNLGMTGDKPGRGIRRTDRQAIDDISSDWHAGPQSAVISQFTYDERSPRTFFVYPPAKAGTQVEISYAAIPPAVVSTSDTLDIGQENFEAVLNYVAYRAKSKDSEYANAAEATAFYAAFNDSLGVQNTSQQASTPNQPGNSV